MARTKRNQRGYSAGERGRNRARVFPDPKTGLYQIEWREKGRRLSRSLKQRIVGSENPGRKSYKVLQDCTICASCRCTGPCWIVLRKRENRFEWREFASYQIPYTRTSPHRVTACYSNGNHPTAGAPGDNTGASRINAARPLRQESRD